MNAVQIKKILVAVDLSPFIGAPTQQIDSVDIDEHVAECVAGYAACLAKGLKAEILAIYVVPTLPDYGRCRMPADVVKNFMDEVIDKAEKAMAEFVKEKFQGLRVQGRVISGHVTEEILNQARENNADIIVMGTHAREGLERLIFGSVAEKVVKGANIPVLSVHTDTLAAK